MTDWQPISGQQWARLLAGCMAHVWHDETGAHVNIIDPLDLAAPQHDTIADSDGDDGA